MTRRLMVPLGRVGLGVAAVTAAAAAQAILNTITQPVSVYTTGS